MVTRRRFSILFTLTALMLVLASAVQALSITSVSGFTLFCDSFTGTVTFINDRDNSGSGDERKIERIFDGDGTLIYLGWTYAGAIGGSGQLAGLELYDILPDHNPIRYELVSLAGNGLPEVVEHTETGSCPGLPDGSAAPPVFTDGRINPQTFAPVVLYCEQSSLSAWAVDGSPLFTFDTAAAETPSTNTVLLSQAGVDLYALADGGFSVVASQSDGKQYQFVFAGCPGIGATAVYISDPATGEFIRAQ